MEAELFVSVWGEAQEKERMLCVSISSQVNLAPRSWITQYPPCHAAQTLELCGARRRVMLSLSTSFISQ